MRSASKTDIGRIRAVNEDRVLVRPGLDGLTLAVVADGMGGHKAGDIASQMAIESIQECLQSVHSGMTAEEREMAVAEAIMAANRNIFEFASAQERYHGMGTTVVVTLADDVRLIIGHIGDSRAYLVNHEQIVQLTEDHSLVWELLRIGQITPAEAQVHPRRNVLTRALGTELGVQVDVGQYAWKRGDIVLMCSDGLSGLVENNQLFQLLRTGHDLQHKVNQLVEFALQAGGDDNISVVLLANVPEDATAQHHSEKRGET